MSVPVCFQDEIPSLKRKEHNPLVRELRSVSNFKMIKKVRFSRFLIFGPFPVNPKINPTDYGGPKNHFRKLEKTPDFDLKSGVFMVAEAGLEPTTSGL